MTRYSVTRVCRSAAAFAMAIFAAHVPVAHADSADQPQIESVRVGLNGVYKLGCWTPFTIDLSGGQQSVSGVVEATTPDADGVPTNVASPFRVDAKAKSQTNLFVRVGQQNAPLVVRLLDEKGRPLITRTLIPGGRSTNSSLPLGLPATNRVVMTCGAANDLAAELARAEQIDSAAEAVRTVRIRRAADLPTAWYGYESVDTVILSGAQPKFYAETETLAPRIEALTRWLEMGGRVVIFCGPTAPKLIAAGGPLAPLVPGRFTGELDPLLNFAPLEIFSEAANPLRRDESKRFLIPKLDDIEGRLLAQGPAGLPLIVRTRRGLGELTFVAVDPEAAPFDQRTERTGLLRAALKWPSPRPESDANRAATGPPNADLVNQLRSALDQHFAGVATTHFGLVAGLVLAYVALIGPADFFLLRRLNRMHWTWITFPLAVIAISGAAYALAYRIKGAEVRLNQVEIVDVDAASGQARGTIWLHFFNPKIQRYDLTVSPYFAGKPIAVNKSNSEPGRPAPGAHASSPSPAAPLPLVSWLGVPGAGLGAMQGKRSAISLFDQGYDYGRNLDALRGLPVEQWSTKSLTARWTADVGATIEAELRPFGDDQLVGQLTNHTGVRLEDCVLMRGGWAYKLPPLDEGAVTVIDDSLPNATIKTTLTSAAAGDDSRVRTAEDGSVLFDSLSTDVTRIAKLMMFYDAIGGAAYAGAPHRYQSFIDMSRLLVGDQAVLLARAPATSGSQWIRAATMALGERSAETFGSERDGRWVFYRFVLPLAKEDSKPRESLPLLGPSPRPTP